MRAEAAWKQSIADMAAAIGDRAKRGREQEESLEVGRFKHLDLEFQRRVHALRLEEFVLKSRCVFSLQHCC